MVEKVKCYKNDAHGTLETDNYDNSLEETKGNENFSENNKG